MKIKKILLYSGTALLLLIVVLLVLPFVINLDSYIGRITAPAGKAIGRQVSIEHIRLTILTGLGLELKGVTVAEKAPSKRPFVHVDDIDVGVELLPLLKKEIDISRVILLRPDVHIVRYDNGTYNFSDLLKAAPGKAGKPLKQTQAAPSVIPEGFYLDRLVISHGRIDISSLEQRKEYTYGVNDINLEVNDFNTATPFTVSLSAYFVGLKDAGLSLKGRVGPIGQHLSVETLPLEMAVSMKHIDIPYLLALAGVKEKVLRSGTMDVNETLGSSSGVTDIDGEIGFSGLTLTNGTIAPFALTNNLQLHQREEILSVKDITLKSQGIELGLRGTVHIPDMAVNADLVSRKLSIASLLAFYSPLGQMLPGTVSISGDAGIKTDIHEDSAGVRTSGTIDLSDAQVKYQDMFVKPASTPFRLSYTLSKQGSLVSLSDIRLILSSLVVSAAGTVSTSGDMPGSITINTGTVELRSLGDIVPLIKSYRAVGSLVLSASAKGPLKEPRKLAVTGGLRVNNVSAQIASLPKPLQSLDVNAAFTRKSVALKSMSVRIGRSTIKASGSISDFSAPQGKLNISSPYLDVDELTPEPKAGQRQPKEQQGPSKAQEQPSILDRADITVSAHVQKGVIKKSSFADLIAVARIAKGSAIVDRFSVRTFDGSISASGTLGMEGARPYNVRLRTTGLNLGDMLSTFTSYKKVMSGRLETRIALNGNAADLKHSVSGNGTITVTNGEIKTFSILSRLTNIAQLANVGSGGTTKFNTLKLTATVDHGKVTSKALRLSSNDLDVSAAGYFDTDGNLDYHGIGTLSRAISNGVGGTTGQIIKNDHGQIEIPFILTGDVRRPSFGLDQAVFQQRLKEIAKKKVIQELNNQLNNELKSNQQIKQMQQNKGLQNMEQNGRKAIENLFR
ncbi:MAG: AsmA family protein [Deltaproteobacteria bacterium]|nr:AsmA family protein [Deltaproteobacteria bacterium]